METVIQFLNSIIEFIGDDTRQGALTLIGSIIAAVIMGGWVFWKEKKKKSPEIYKNNLDNNFEKVPNSSGNITLTIEEYDRRLRQREEELIDKIHNSAGAERETLLAEKEELAGRLENIQSSYESAVSKIRELEGALSKAGEDINEKRIASAMTALQNGDSTLALEIFNEVESALEPALKRAAESAYGKGLIAEERVDWRDAANHFQRSVSFYPTELNLYQAGIYLWRAGFYLPAVFANRQHIELIEKRCGRKSAEYAGALNNLAAQLYELREVDEAIDTFEESLAIQRSLGAASSMDYACGLANLANVYVMEEKIETAERLLRQALEIAKVAPDCDAERLVSIKNALAETLRYSEKFEESEDLFKKVINEDLERFGPEHPYHARDLHFYSKLLRDVQRYDEAKGLLYTAIRIARKSMGEHHPNTFAIANHFAWILRATEATEEDEKMLRDLEAVFGSEIGVDDTESSTPSFS